MRVPAVHGPVLQPGREGRGLLLTVASGQHGRHGSAWLVFSFGFFMLQSLDKRRGRVMALERDISREAIKLLTDMLVDLAGRDPNGFGALWPPLPAQPARGDVNNRVRHDHSREWTRYHVRHQPFFAGPRKRDALVTILTEPDFLLCFRFPQDACNHARVVDLQTMPDRVIRKTWSRTELEDAANQLA